MSSIIEFFGNDDDDDDDDDVNAFRIMVVVKSLNLLIFLFSVASTFIRLSGESWLNQAWKIVRWTNELMTVKDFFSGFVSQLFRQSKP